MGLLDGKVAIVTGAGRGVGKAEAMAMAAEGASVVINDLGGSVDGTGTGSRIADEVVAEIQAAGGNAAANYSDVGSLDGVDQMVWTALSRFNRLDIMVHNAGILRDKTLMNMEECDWDMVQKVHSRGAFLCTRAAARVMRNQGQGGVIMNTSSMSGLVGNFGQANYSHAKAGIYGFTKTAAMELGRYGIRVHGIIPNAYTRMTSDLPGLRGITEEMLDPSALAPVVVYLASDLSRELNGRVLLSHGGTIGVKITEFKMQMNHGYNTKKGIPTAQDIAENIDKILFEGPDLQIGDSMKFD